MRHTVTQCLGRAMMCQLQGSPAADDIAVVIDTYLQVFGAKGLKNEDAPRVEYAFRVWTREQSRFPTPHDILAGLPMRKHRITEASKRIEHDTEAAAAKSDAIARENLGKMKALAAGAWRTGDDWDEELALKYCRDIDTSPEGVKRAISEAL